MRHLKNQSALAKATDVSQPTISRFSKGKFGADALLKVLDFLGARIVFPDDPQTEVVLASGPDERGKLNCITIPKITERELNRTVKSLAKTDNLIAISTNILPASFGQNLIAVQLGVRNDRFHPFFLPRDIVIFDRDVSNRFESQTLSIINMDGSLHIAMARFMIQNGTPCIVIFENLKNISTRLINMNSETEWNDFVLGAAVYSFRVL